MCSGYPAPGTMQNIHIFGQLPGQPVIQALPISQGWLYQLYASANMGYICFQHQPAFFIPALCISQGWLYQLYASAKDGYTSCTHQPILVITALRFRQYCLCELYASANTYWLNQLCASGNIAYVSFTQPKLVISALLISQNWLYQLYALARVGFRGTVPTYRYQFYVHTHLPRFVTFISHSWGYQLHASAKVG